LDISNKAFWEKLSHTFAETTKLLYEKAAEHGIDLDAVMTENKVDYKKQMQDELLKVEAHPLTKLATKYTHTARKLYDTIRKENFSLQKIESEINLGIKDELLPNPMLMNILILWISSTGTCFRYR
jgi:TRAP-type C4-dicarboxylate transport system substrate-binding protein